MSLWKRAKRSVPLANTFIMEITQINTADILDIIFEGRNKEYGAYDLRKTYNTRLSKALMFTGVVCLVLTGGYVLAGKLSNHVAAPPPDISEVNLESLKQEKKQQQIIEPPKLKPVEVKTIRNIVPLIVPDKEVKPEDQVPENKDLEDAKIGFVNKAGESDGDIVAPPVDGTSKGIIEAPKKEEDEKPFTSVQIESQYPGGIEAWQRFLIKNFHYPGDVENVEGTVIVQFIVDKDGKVSDVHAVSGPSELYAEAERVIKKSGNWTVAFQNGRQVPSYKKQPIVVRVDPQN